MKNNDDFTPSLFKAAFENGYRNCGLNYTELSKKLGCAPSTVSGLRNDTISDPDDNFLERADKLFGYEKGHLIKLRHQDKCIRRGHASSLDVSTETQTDETLTTLKECWPQMTPEERASFVDFLQVIIKNKKK